MTWKDVIGSATHARESLQRLSAALTQVHSRSCIALTTSTLARSCASVHAQVFRDPSVVAPWSTLSREAACSMTCYSKRLHCALTLTLNPSKAFKNGATSTGWHGMSPSSKNQLVVCQAFTLLELVALVIRL